jgi:hypothetical protein
MDMRHELYQHTDTLFSLGDDWGINGTIEASSNKPSLSSTF